MLINYNDYLKSKKKYLSEIFFFKQFIYVWTGFYFYLLLKLRGLKIENFTYEIRFEYWKSNISKENLVIY